MNLSLTRFQKQGFPLRSDGSHVGMRTDRPESPRGSSPTITPPNNISPRVDTAYDPKGEELEAYR